MGLGVKGHPDPLYRAPDYNRATPLFIEMKIAAEYLHCTHEQFLKLPKDERVKLLLYEEMSASIEKHFRTKAEEERRNKARTANNRQSPGTGRVRK